METIRRKTPVAAILLVVYWLILFVGTHAPKVPGVSVHHLDKLLHFAAYSGLAWLLSWVIQPSGATSPRRYFFVFLATATYGIIDELTQMLVANRQADVWDWLADISGAGLGIGLHFLASTLLAGIGTYRSREPAGSRDET